MKKDFKIQTIPISLGSIFASIITNIIGYIVLYFFKPLWDKFVNWLNK